MFRETIFRIRHPRDAAAIRRRIRNNRNTRNIDEGVLGSVIIGAVLVAFMAWATGLGQDVAAVLRALS